MAYRQNTTRNWGALASILMALAIGSVPIATLITLNERISAEVAL